MEDALLMNVPLDWHPTPEGVELTGWQGDVLPRFPIASGSQGVASPIRLLEELWGRNILKQLGASALLPWPSLYELDQHERTLLGLPEPDERLRANVKTDLWTSAERFRIWIDVVFDGPRPTPIPADQRVGPMFRLPEGAILPPREIGELVSLLSKPLPPTVDERSVLVAEVKRLAKSCPQIVLDAFLSKEDYVVPDSLGIDVRSVSPDEIKLRATAEGMQDADYRGFPDGPARTVYTQHAPGGRRRRLVLRPGQQEAVRYLQDNGTLTGPDVPAFFDNPVAFLPDEIAVDPTEFSKRVRGLLPAVYHSQPYVSVARGKRRGWFDAQAGVKITKETDEHGQKDRADARGPSGTDGRQGEITTEDFRKLVKEADESGSRYVKYKDGWIEIDPERARPFLDFCDEHPPDEEGGGRTLNTSTAQFVLDVFPNTEALEYAEPDGDTASSPAARKCYPVPRSLKARLLPHQVIGYNWMRSLHESNRGGLLADDMGLGKTVQIIAFMSHLHEQGKLRPALVVAPVAVIANWQRELQRFAPAIEPAHEHRGPGRERDPDRLAQHEVVITSYDTLRRDQLDLGRVDWSVIACDEAQNVKNPTAGVTSAAKGMKATFRLACTGTPVENGLSELWCIVDFSQPGRLGSRSEFRREFERPLVHALEKAENGVADDLVRRLRSRLNPHYIRRTKDEVLDLPSKSDRTYEVAMSPRQADLYDHILDRVKSRQTNPLGALQRLIAVCSHPLAFNNRTHPQQDPRQLLEDAPKLSQTLEIVEGIRGSSAKVVIYTRFRAMQRILQVVLRDRFRFEPVVLNGLVPGHNRHRIVEAFNGRPGFDVMILSPEAAGVGLNITGATHVIHYTRLWNPAKENQATDRVHRIGQRHPVTVHYPVVAGNGFKSVEEHLHDLLSEKLQLARNVLAPRKRLDVSGELEKRVVGQSDAIR